jgi:hypothetical protein
VSPEPSLLHRRHTPRDVAVAHGFKSHPTVKLLDRWTRGAMDEKEVAEVVADDHDGTRTPTTASASDHGWSVQGTQRTHASGSTAQGAPTPEGTHRLTAAPEPAAYIAENL